MVWPTSRKKERQANFLYIEKIFTFAILNKIKQIRKTATLETNPLDIHCYIIYFKKRYGNSFIKDLQHCVCLYMQHSAFIQNQYRYLLPVHFYENVVSRSCCELNFSLSTPPPPSICMNISTRGSVWREGGKLIGFIPV